MSPMNPPRPLVAWSQTISCAWASGGSDHVQHRRSCHGSCRDADREQPGEADGAHQVAHESRGGFEHLVLSSCYWVACSPRELVSRRAVGFLPTTSRCPNPRLWYIKIGTPGEEALWRAPLAVLACQQGPPGGRHVVPCESSEDRRIVRHEPKRDRTRPAFLGQGPPGRTST